MTEAQTELDKPINALDIARGIADNSLTQLGKAFQSKNFSPAATTIGFSIFGVLMTTGVGITAVDVGHVVNPDATTFQALAEGMKSIPTLIANWDPQSVAELHRWTSSLAVPSLAALFDGLAATSAFMTIKNWNSPK